MRRNDLWQKKIRARRREPEGKAVCFISLPKKQLSAAPLYFCSAPVSTGLPDRILGGGKEISFTQLKKDDIPQTIEKDVIPEYRELERALGCLVDGKVYVVVTRGEKPTAGYDLAIEQLRLQKTEDGGSNMVVTALFKEPAEGETVSRIITYPYVVAETELTELPDTIELVVRYAE